jgi:hypothetical protein
VETFFPKLDFRRFQVDLNMAIPMDDPTHIPDLIKYGEKLGQMILDDQVDEAMGVEPLPMWKG